MWKSIAVLPLLLLLAACVEPEPRDTPTEGLIRVYTALNNQDSLGYLRSVTRDKRQVYQALPGALHGLLDQWQGQHAEIAVLSVAKNDSVATILYNLKTAGYQQDSLMARMYLVDGWKLGY